jgi:hypothetical protein|tara:strand:+ start:277 stop:501 length:225 start_codon:yes stop_codon:yes gene_type:complete
MRKRSPETAIFKETFKEMGSQLCHLVSIRRLHAQFYASLQWEQVPVGMVWFRFVLKKLLQFEVLILMNFDDTFE